jgi:hypothetical protein
VYGVRSDEVQESEDEVDASAAPDPARAAKAYGRF